MKKLISGILMFATLMISLPILAATSTLPEGYEVTDFRFFINDELQQITVYRNSNFFQSDEKEYVPLQACMEALGCTFERKSPTNIMIKTPDNRTIDMSIGEKTISYTGGLRGVARVPWEYMELDGTIYYNDADYGEVRIVASSSNLKCGSIVQFNLDTVSNKPITAIVLDRGVTGTNLDLLMESEDAAIRYVGGRLISYSVLRNGYNR